MSKPVLVTGATGTIGRDVARQLSAKGVAVRAGVRDKAKARNTWPDIALVPFDFENEKTFSEALEGVEKVFLLPPLLPKSAGSNECVRRCRGTRRCPSHCETLGHRYR